MIQGAATEALSSGYRLRPVLEFRILGPLEVIENGIPVPLGGPKQRAALAILLLHANRVVSIDRFADDLYAGAPPVTAVTQVQRQVSELRKAVGAGHAIETRAPGYLIHTTMENLDLSRFEGQVNEAGRALARGDAQEAADLVREALALWRGVPLADLAYEPFAQLAASRLDEIRLAAHELLVDAKLALGRHGEVIPELTALVEQHPLRENLSAQLMLALYRSGRQPEALAVYRRAREALVGQFGIEPTPVLRALEHAILTHDPSLDLDAASTGTAPFRAVLIMPSHESRLDGLLALADRLAAPSRELIIARLVTDEDELQPAVAVINAHRAALAMPARSAVFTSSDRVGDAVRLITQHHVDLVLVDAPPEIAESVPEDLAVLFERSPAHVALLSGATPHFGERAVYVPFGGDEHAWAALELAAWLASATAPRAAGVTPAACSPTRRSRCSARAASRRSSCWQSLPRKVCWQSSRRPH
jgi:DNA-binding SARP family transcriptional activator